VRRTAAAVQLAKADAAPAAELAVLAAEDAAAGGSPLESGRSRIVAARALAQARARDHARLQLEKAELELDSCGATGYRDEAVAELRRLDFRRREAPNRTGSGLGSLTERERLIAELVSEGKTNREIASACYLSVKTVERHIAHLFDKLGVGSRAAVATVVSRTSPS
jgi:DNA-binding NarL/FixJ family response regulator